MRLSCSFKCKEFPVSYQMLGVSLIKQALEKSNVEYFNKLYKYGENANKKSKNFCFSVFVSNYEIQNDVFNVNGDVIINFTTPDLEFGINLYNGLLSIKEFTYKDFKLTKDRVYLQKENDFSGDEVVLKTLSPIFLKNKNNEQLLPGHDEYEKELNYILNVELKNYRGYGLSKPIEILFKENSIKKKVIKEEIREFAQKTDKKIFYINSFSGVFKLRGNNKDLRDIYQLGIGMRRSQGFGMVEVIG